MRERAALHGRQLSAGAAAAAASASRSGSPRPAGAVSSTVLLADDQDAGARRIPLILESEPDIEVIGEAADGEQAVAAARRLRPTSS